MKNETIIYSGFLLVPTHFDKYCFKMNSNQYFCTTYNDYLIKRQSLPTQKL